jgi:hypothetical protein
MRTVLKGPGGLKVELDRNSETPIMVVLGDRTGTFYCVLETGEIDDKTISGDQGRWLDSIEDQV